MADMKIMIVEDENIVAEDIRQCLESLNYTVQAVVSTGEEAVKRAGEKRPDLVIMDIMLRGGMDGIEAARRIYKLYDIPVVFLTAYADDLTLHRAKLSEPFGYVLKPFDEKKLQSSIEMAIYKHSMEKRLRQRERWLSSTLNSIGEAVITVDNKRRITFMNPVAEMLTGWDKKEAVGRGLESVFRIMDRGGAIENPVDRALDECIIVWPSNYTLLARNGTKVSINVSAAPISSDSGDVTGAVLAFRDFSEYSRAVKERDRLLIEFLQKKLSKPGP